MKIATESWKKGLFFKKFQLRVGKVGDLLKNEEIFYVVNKDGEVIKEVNIDRGDKLTIETKEEQETKKKTKEFLKETTELSCSFFKIAVKSARKLDEDYPFLLQLLSYTGYIDCVLKYDNGTVINMDSLGKLLGGSKEYVRQRVKKMENDEILIKEGRGKSSYFIVNPYICFKGKRISKEVLSKFENSKWRDDNGEI